MFSMLHSHTCTLVFERNRGWVILCVPSLPFWLKCAAQGKPTSRYPFCESSASGSAGLHRDLDLSSVYRSSISLVPFLPLAVRLMMCWVKPKGRAAPGIVQSRNWGDSSSSPCLKTKKQRPWSNRRPAARVRLRRLQFCIQIILFQQKEKENEIAKEHRGEWRPLAVFATK